MPTYKLIIAYDGTDYYGWQSQLHKQTVADVLAARFKRVFDQNVVVLGASRTDAGVHALGQVATVRTDLQLNPERMRQAWNGRLPSDILIRSIETVTHFHPQHNVQFKQYWYVVCTKRPLPQMARYAYWYRFPIDEQKLRNCLQAFVGTHDFRSFCTGPEYEDTIRTIDAIHIVAMPHMNAYKIVVQGPRFLRYMIRRIVGSALHIASQPHLQLSDLQAVFAARSPQHDLPTAPAHGLVLRKIVYAEQ